MKIGRIEQFETKKSYCLEISQSLWFGLIIILKYPKIIQIKWLTCVQLATIGSLH